MYIITKLLCFCINIDLYTILYLYHPEDQGVTLKKLINNENMRKRKHADTCDSIPKCGYQSTSRISARQDRDLI